MSKPKTREELNKNDLWQWIIEQEQVMLVDYEYLSIEENPPKGYIEEREEYYQKCKQAYNQVKKIIKQHFEYTKEVEKSMVALKKMRKRIQNQPEVDEEWIEKKAKEMANIFGVIYHFYDDRLKDFIRQLVKEIQPEKPEVDEEEIDDLIDDVIDIVLQNSYVVFEKTSDGTGKEYYDNQLFPEKGCEEKVKKLLQRIK